MLLKITIPTGFEVDRAQFKVTLTHVILIAATVAVAYLAIVAVGLRPVLVEAVETCSRCVCSGGGSVLGADWVGRVSTSTTAR